MQNKAAALVSKIAISQTPYARSHITENSADSTLNVQSGYVNRMGNMRSARAVEGFILSVYNCGLARAADLIILGFS